MKKLIFLLAVTSIFFAACHHETEGKEVPIVTISSPTEGQEFKSGTAIAVKGVASDDAGLHEGQILIVKTSDNSQLNKQEPTVHDLLSYTIDYSYTPTVTVATDMKIIATFYDHDDNKTEKVVNFKVIP